jgi:hypothetical protein
MFYETVNTKEDDVDNNVERERKYSLWCSHNHYCGRMRSDVNSEGRRRMVPASCRFRWWGVAELSTSTAVAEERVDFELAIKTGSLVRQGKDWWVGYVYH